jgi:hypothetical protein
MRVRRRAEVALETPALSLWLIDTAAAEELGIAAAEEVAAPLEGPAAAGMTEQPETTAAAGTTAAAADDEESTTQEMSRKETLEVSRKAT